jgi:muconolactone delta-isomerase
MAKFLVMTHPKEPMTDSGYRRLPKRVEHWAGLRDRGAEVYSIVGRKGYAIFVDVDSHDELIDILHKNPMVQDEETEVFPLGTVEGEVVTAGEAKFGDLAEL